MSSLANPNWLAVGAAFFSMCGAGLLLKALVHGTAATSDPDERSRAAALRRIATAIGAPMLGVGLFMNALSQIATSTLSPLMVGLMLGLAFAMLLYACLEDTMIDAVIGERDGVRRAPKLALLPPASSAHELREAAIEPKTVEAAAS